MVRGIVRAASLAFVLISPGTSSGEHENELLINDIARAASRILDPREVTCSYDTEESFSGESEQLTGDLTRASRDGVGAIRLYGLEGIEESNLPSALAIWLFEIRNRGGDVVRRVRDSTESSGDRDTTWDMPDIITPILSSIETIFSLVAREWVYNPAGAYNATVEVDRIYSSGRPIFYLSSITLNCRR